MAKAGVLAFAEGGGFSVGVGGQIFAGAMTAGAIANHLAQKQKMDRPKKIKGATADQLKRITAAIDDLVERIKNKDDCAKVLGGRDKALKAIRESTISVEPLDPGQISSTYKLLIEPPTLAETEGSTIKLGSNTIFNEGTIEVFDISTGQMVPWPADVVDADNLGAMMGHEVGHRTKSKELNQRDAKDMDANKANTEKVRKACGY